MYRLSGPDPDGAGLVIVADQATEYGGAERAVEALLRRYPAAHLMAPHFTATAGTAAHFEARLHAMRAEGTAEAWRGDLRIVGRGGRRRHFYGPVYARRLAREPVVGAATVLSVGCAAWSLGVTVPPGTRHVAWMGGPPRALYGHSTDYLREYPRPLRGVLRSAVPALRAHHRMLLRRPEAVLSNSYYSAAGLREIAGRPVGVIYPPVRTDYFTPARGDEPGERSGFVAVARLRHSKRVDVLVDAFRGLEHELVVAGDGPLLERLRATAPPNVRFAGHLEDAPLRDLYRRSAGLVTASVEEFGICLVEALACGTPVAGPRRGGSGEIVVPGDCGVLVDAVTPATIAAAVREIAAAGFSPAACRRRAERFSEERFVTAIGEAVGAAATAPPPPSMSVC